MRRTGTTIALAVGVLLLASCASPDGTGFFDRLDGGSGSSSTREGVAPRDEPPGASETPIAGRRQVSCAERSGITLEGQGIRFVVTGDCGDVSVRGQRLNVRMAASTSLTIEGQDIDVFSSAGVGTLQLSGDDNDVEARTIAAVRIAGNDNDVEADTIGSVVITGDDNDVEAGNDPAPVTITGTGNEVGRR